MKLFNPFAEMSFKKRTNKRQQHNPPCEPQLSAIASEDN